MLEDLVQDFRRDRHWRLLLLWIGSLEQLLVESIMNRRGRTHYRSNGVGQVARADGHYDRRQHHHREHQIPLGGTYTWAGCPANKVIHGFSR